MAALLDVLLRQYDDEDGDKVMIAVDEDLAAAVTFARAAKVKVMVTLSIDTEEKECCSSTFNILERSICTPRFTPIMHFGSMHGP